MPADLPPSLDPLPGTPAHPPALAALLAKAGKSPLASKKLWVTLAGIAGIVVPALVTGGVSLPVVLGVAPAVVAYVLGQAHVDAATVKALSDVTQAVANKGKA